MKSLICLCLILFIINISPVFSQWLEKEGYWELSEKIPDLRHLKILPEENLIITVSKDNTIRHIEYDSGKILKSGKPEGLTDSNDYAKISSDGKTTVVARYVKNEKYSTLKNLNIYDMELVLFNNDDLSIIANQYFDANSILNIYSNGGHETFQLLEYNYSFGYFDYFLNTNTFFYAINYTLNFKGKGSTGGEPSYYISSGFQIKGEISMKNFVQIYKHNNFSTSDYLQSKINSKVYFFVGELVDESGNAHSGNHHISHITGNLNQDTLEFKINLEFDYTSNYSFDHTGNGSSSEEGKVVPIYQLFSTAIPDIFFYRLSGKLVQYNIESKQNISAFQNPIFTKTINLSNNSKLIHIIDSNDYIIYSFPYLKQIYKLSVQNPFSTSKAFLDESNGIILLPDSLDNLIMIKPDPMQDIAKFGFDWSKDTIYTGETIIFRGLSNIEGCVYEWDFGDGKKEITQKPEINHSYTQPGLYSVSLAITKPGGSQLSFTKDSIITVLEKVKADFDITFLNSGLPLKVQFSDKSTGNIKSWSWDFGDGETSDEQNPVHEYKYHGDFSPRLIITDNRVLDTIIKFESIISGTENSNLSSKYSQHILQKSTIIFRNAFLTENGINLNWTYNYSQPSGYLDNKDYYIMLYSNIYNFELQKYDSLITQYPVFNLNDLMKTFCWLNPNRIIFNFNFKHYYAPYTCEPISYNFEENKFIANTNKKLLFTSLILPLNPSTLYFIGNAKPNPTIIKTDELYNTISELTIQDTLTNKYLADTISGGLNLILKKMDNSYKYFLISPENTINYEKSFSLDTNITLSNIKSVNENLILLYGSVADKENNTSYAYFGKYHPFENSIKDTIHYSRKDIRKIERINDKWYAAIGQSRGRQGYLILDTNLQQVKDIRVDSLTGEIKDMLLHDNKVYLFTEKIIIEATNSLGPNERYQTTGSVLELPEEIIADTNENPFNSGKTFIYTVYPNPANDMFRLKIGSNSTSIYTIKLYDLFGREVMKIFDGIIDSGTEKVFNLPVSGLNTGTYYYTINNVFNTDSGKVMVVR